MSEASKSIRFLAHLCALAAASAGAFAVITAGCGRHPKPVDDPAPIGRDVDRPRRPRMGITSEIGSLDETQVKQVLERVSDKLAGCYAKGTARVPYLSGDVRFKLRVTNEGRVRRAYVKDSSLGDRDTEECMLSALKAVSWPKPTDGDEGLVESGFSFEAASDERMPVPWSPDQLGDSFRDAGPKLSRCRRDAGAGPLKATLYVETDGTPGPIGVSASDEKGEGAVGCVVSTLRGLTFPSPGSFASKVTVTID